MSSIDTDETNGNTQDQQPEPAAKQKRKLRKKLIDPDAAAALRQEEWEQQAQADEDEDIGADDRPKIMASSRDRRTFGLCMRELGYAFRSNRRSLGLEVSIDGALWTDVEDGFVHWLRSEFPLEVLITTSAQQGPRRWEIGPEQFNSWLEALGYENRADPFMEYGMRAAETWDGQPRTGSILQELFGADDTPVTRAANHLIFELAADRTLHPGKPSKEIPVLLGPQGIGKSPFLRVLTPRPALAVRYREYEGEPEAAFGGHRRQGHRRGGRDVRREEHLLPGCQQGLLVRRRRQRHPPGLRSPRDPVATALRLCRNHQ